MTRSLPVVVLLVLTATACAARYPLTRQECLRADADLQRALEALEVARAGGCNARTVSGSCVAHEEAIEGLLLACPSHNPTRLVVATFALDVQQPERAQAILDQILDIAGTHPEAAVLRAQVAVADGNLPFARRLLFEQVKLAPDHAELRETLGAVFYLSGRLDDARDALGVAGRLGAPAWRVAYHLGLVEEAAGRAELAVAHYRDALIANPDAGQARSRLNALTVGAVPGVSR